MNNDTYLEPFRAFLAKAEALEAETNASFTAALCIWALITFLKEKQQKNLTWERERWSIRMRETKGV
jgi:hypothetical protein